MGSGAPIQSRRRMGVAALAVLVTLPPVALSAWAWRTVAAVDLGRLRQGASVVLAAGHVILPGSSVEAGDLLGTLRRLGYRETQSAPSAPGQFRSGPDGWEIYLRARSDPGATRPALAARLAVAGGRVTGITTADGGRLSQLELEPEVLAGGGTAGQLARPVPLTAVPPDLVSAVLAAEDRRFFEHHGVDGRAVLRALWVDLRRGEVVQGGSTLTQQLVKNAVLTPERTWLRKGREVVLAVAVERRHDKQEILGAYLNGVYLGQHGGLPVYGVGAAAKSFFGKDVERLTLGEAALLAGIIRAPNAYSPVQHPGRARERRDLVLGTMRRLGMIDAARYARATRERVAVRPGPAGQPVGAYFTDFARAEAEELEPDGEPLGPGLRIYTTLDPVLQRAAELAVARGLDRLESRWTALRRADPAGRLQAALLALDPATGEVRAMVGGRDYAQSQWNRATQARRQAGSAFKPFVYLAALRPGPHGEPPPFTPASLLEDRPRTIVTGGGRGVWAPRNYEGRFEGTVTVRRALEQSLNAATVWMAERVGWDSIVGAAREAGLTSPLAPVPSIALGSFEVTPLELAAAYAPFANGGRRVTPTALRAVVDRAGGVLEPSRPAPARAMRAEAAFLLTHLLAGVVDRGTGAPARLLGVEGPVSGKTGTTNEGRDAWFVGYTPQLVALVWVGFDQADVARLSGGQAALPIWADFMRTAMAAAPGGAFAAPPSIVFRDVDAHSGKLATPFCPVVVREAFLPSTEPREPCGDHGPGGLARSLWARLFRALPAGAPPSVSDR